MKTGKNLFHVFLFVFYFTTKQIVFADDFFKTTELDGRKVCLTTDCIKTAALLLNNMDQTVDPCEDFYDFSCGGFHRSHFSKNSYVFVDTLLDDRIKAQLKKLLSQASKEREPESFRKTRDYFASCVDESKMAEVGVEPLKQFLSYFGGWPVVEGDNWDEDSFEWTNFTAKLASEGLPEATGIVGVGYFRNYHYYKEREFVMLEVTRPYTFMVSGKPFNSSGEQALYRLLVGVATHLGADEDRAKEEMKEVWEFVNDYRNAAESKRTIGPGCNCTASEEDCEEECEEWTPFPNLQNLNETEKGDKTKFITIGDLYNVTDEVDWLSYIRAAYSPHVNLSTTVAFRIADPATLKNMTELIINTPKRVLANYVLWKAIHGLFVLVRDSKLTELVNVYENTTEPRPPPRELKWNVCLNEIGRYFRYSLTALYFRTYLNQGEREDVGEMYNNIRKTFLQTLNESSWLTDETREKAKSKLTSLEAHIAYPNELNDNKLLDKYYNSLVTTKGEYVTNFWNVIKFTHSNEAKLIGHFTSRSHWPNLQSILSTNAFYYHAINAISIPATQVRGIYFSKNRQKAINYGSLGSIIGHEVLHGFNELGVSEDTNRRMNKWWHDDDTNAFKERAKCIISQYGRFGSRRVGQLDGKDTLDENLSDNEGIRASYDSYQKYVEEHGEEPSLPGLAYSPNQLFWIAYGNSWCKVNHRPLTQELRFGMHSPPRYRVLGAISNMEKFAEDFNCPIGSIMNPKDKCSVWGSDRI